MILVEDCSLEEQILSQRNGRNEPVLQLEGIGSVLHDVEMRFVIVAACFEEMGVVEEEETLSIASAVMGRSLRGWDKDIGEDGGQYEG